ncbi:methylmalonyl-CoA epimerase [Alkalicoccobacillus murimartini]|uniref:Methylmalonyl-CoA/ethylmalonyl-CoA epimerase n=1 Tax=Alkalicoccobacillus murimartini TaxID=171685 RepID=A0ABT9YD28_9BACI|nr:methylmalonyl-CoA epimerase [Alkalicoccobacillus murimartini]MDQ0205631.1 methylmalonyl-CoA/ethylmalonyl-CoA epimerase [Alkalicoccobacillus murimartini]
MSNQWQQAETHIAIAVYSIQAARGFYEHKLGLSWVKEEVVQEQGVKLALLKAGSTNIELLEPLTEDSPVAKFLQKNGEGIHHLALGTSDLHTQMTSLKHTGISFVSNQPVSGANGTNIAFIPPNQTHGVLLELCEKQGFKRETENEML